MKRCSWIIELHNNKDRTYRKGQNKIHFTDKRTTFYLFRSNYSFRIEQIVIKNEEKELVAQKQERRIPVLWITTCAQKRKPKNPVFLFCAEKTVFLIKCRGCWNECVNTFPVAWLHIVSAFKSNHFCRWIVMCFFVVLFICYGFSMTNYDTFKIEIWNSGNLIPMQVIIPFHQTQCFWCAFSAIKKLSCIPFFNRTFLNSTTFTKYEFHSSITILLNYI